jgi:hypothetical protein
LIEVLAVLVVLQKQTDAGLGYYALIAARSGRTPMMFMTRVRL